MTQHAFAHLSLWFRLAYYPSIYSTPMLMNDLGHLGDTECAQEILDGTYTFPLNTDEWTIKILQEAHHTWMLLNNEPISTTISVAHFQGYWQKANEKISSSHSTLHFGHYKPQASPKTYRHCTPPNSQFALERDFI
jgi:hypothetical protein